MPRKRGKSTSTTETPEKPTRRSNRASRAKISNNPEWEGSDEEEVVSKPKRRGKAVAEDYDSDESSEEAQPVSRRRRGGKAPAAVVLPAVSEAPEKVGGRKIRLRRTRAGAELTQVAEDEPEEEAPPRRSRRTRGTRGRGGSGSEDRTAGAADSGSPVEEGRKKTRAPNMSPIATKLSRTPSGHWLVCPSTTEPEEEDDDDETEQTSSKPSPELPEQPASTTQEDPSPSQEQESPQVTKTPSSDEASPVPPTLQREEMTEQRSTSDLPPPVLQQSKEDDSSSSGSSSSGSSSSSDESDSDDQEASEASQPLPSQENKTQTANSGKTAQPVDEPVEVESKIPEALTQLVKETERIQEVVPLSEADTAVAAIALIDKPVEPSTVIINEPVVKVPRAECNVLEIESAVSSIITDLENEKMEETVVASLIVVQPEEPIVEPDSAKQVEQETMHMETKIVESQTVAPVVEPVVEEKPATGQSVDKQQENVKSIPELLNKNVEVVAQKEVQPIQEGSVKVVEEVVAKESPSKEKKVDTEEVPSKEPVVVKESPSKENVVTKESPVKEKAVVKELPCKELIESKELATDEKIVTKESPLKEKDTVRESPSKEKIIAKESPSKETIVAKNLQSNVKDVAEESPNKKPVAIETLSQTQNVAKESQSKGANVAKESPIKEKKDDVKESPSKAKVLAKEPECKETKVTQESPSKESDVVKSVPSVEQDKVSTIKPVEEKAKISSPEVKQKDESEKVVKEPAAEKKTSEKTSQEVESKDDKETPADRDDKNYVEVLVSEKEKILSDDEDESSDEATAVKRQSEEARRELAKEQSRRQRSPRDEGRRRRDDLSRSEKGSEPRGRDSRRRERSRSPIRIADKDKNKDAAKAVDKDKDKPRDKSSEKVRDTSRSSDRSSERKKLGRSSPIRAPKSQEKDNIKKSPSPTRPKPVKRIEKVSLKRNRLESSETAENVAVVESETPATPTEVTTPVAPTKKRRWGKSNATKAANNSPAIAISTDMLKNLIPDAKPVPEEEVNKLLLDEEEVTVAMPEAEKVVSKRDSRGAEALEMLKQTGDASPTHEAPMMPEAPAQDVEMHAEVEIIPRGRTVRKISALQDDARALQKTPSPPRHAPTSILHITNLVRPFTLPQLKELLSRTGTILEENFWIDKIKSKCLVEFSTEEEARNTRHALHGVRWPITNPKRLNVDFASFETLVRFRSVDDGESRPSKDPVKVLASNGTATIGEARRESERDRDHKPRIASRSGPGDFEDRSSSRRIKVEGPVREWDLHKINQSDSEERPRYDDRSRDSDPRRGRKRSYSPSPERKEKKKPDECSKLLDDLFLKTKTTPCIYWLPLSTEQIAEKEQIRRQHMAEHERRLADMKRSDETRGSRINPKHYVGRRRSADIRRNKPSSGRRSRRSRSDSPKK